MCCDDGVRRRIRMYWRCLLTNSCSLLEISLCTKNVLSPEHGNGTCESGDCGFASRCDHYLRTVCPNCLLWPESSPSHLGAYWSGQTHKHSSILYYFHHWIYKYVIEVPSFESTLQVLWTIFCCFLSQNFIFKIVFCYRMMLLRVIIMCIILITRMRCIDKCIFNHVVNGQMQRLTMMLTGNRVIVTFSISRSTVGKRSDTALDISSTPAAVV